MDAVSWRQKQIQYASRTAHSIRSLATEHNLRRALAGVQGRVPRGAVDIQAVGDAPSFASDRSIQIVHVIYHPSEDQVSESDAEFSRPSIAKRRAAGYADLRRAIDESPWTRHRPALLGGTLVHRVHRGRLQANVPVQEPSLKFMQDG